MTTDLTNLKKDLNAIGIVDEVPVVNLFMNDIRELEVIDQQCKDVSAKYPNQSFIAAINFRFRGTIKIHYLNGKSI